MSERTVAPHPDSSTMDDERPDVRRPDDLSEGELSEREPTAPGLDGTAPETTAEDRTMPETPEDRVVHEDRVGPDTTEDRMVQEDRMVPETTEVRMVQEDRAGPETTEDRMVQEDRVGPETTEDRAEPTPVDPSVGPAVDRPTEPVSRVDEADLGPRSDVDDLARTDESLDPTDRSDVDVAPEDAVDTTHRPEAEPEEPEVVAQSDVDTGAAPGDVELEPVAALWPGDVADRLRSRWQEVQLRFVDEPRQAADEADQLVEEVVSTLTQSLQRTRAELGQWRSTSGSDGGETEHLRVAVRRYREFLDTVLTL